MMVKTNSNGFIGNSDKNTKLKHNLTKLKPSSTKYIFTLKNGKLQTVAATKSKDFKGVSTSCWIK